MVQVTIQPPIKRFIKVEELISNFVDFRVNYYKEASPTFYIPASPKPIYNEVFNSEDIEVLCANFKEQFLTYYLPELNRYSDPLEVLKLWDSLDFKGRSNTFQDPHKYSKMLILAK